jgi:hypothetical protein
MAEPKLIQVESFNGKYFIKESYRPIAQALVKKFDEISHVMVNNVLFVEDQISTKKKAGKTIFAQVSKVPEKWDDIIYQITGRHFDYMMEIYKINIFQMSREQIYALIYHELRHIDTDGEIKGHDIEDWTNMIEKLGADWNVTRNGIPNLLDEHVNWEDIIGPATLFPAETTLRLVKNE